MRIIFVLVLLSLAPWMAVAAEPEPEVESSQTLDTRDRVLATSAAVLPGVVLHGAGHWVAGEESTAYTLLIAEGIGIVGIVGGLAGLAVTGAASDFVVPLATTTIAGMGFFTTSLLADIYGVAAPAPSGSPVVREADLDLRAGYQNVYNPALDASASSFLHLDGTWSWRMLRIDAETAIGLDADTLRVATGLTWRLFGPRSDRTAESGSRIDLRLGYSQHRWGELGFTDRFGELEGSGRLDLSAVGRSLKGSFVTAHTGAAIGAHDYHLERLLLDSDIVLLGGFGFGLYLGESADGFGEVEIYYDHRHDGFVGGFKMPGLGSGAIGHFGLRAEYGIWQGLGVAARIEAGASLLTQINIVYRFGGQR